jgi:hypothetical protein
MPGLDAAALLLLRVACGTGDLLPSNVKTRFETVQALLILEVEEQAH